MHSGLRIWILACFMAFPIIASTQGFDPTKIDETFNRTGQKTGDVYKIGFPRTDLHVVVDGITLKPGLALGSWAAFTGTDDKAMVMGDLVLLESEVNPVMLKLRADGFEITAVHNPVIEAEPRVMYMRYMGQGPSAKLASTLQAALALSKTPLSKPAAGGEEPPSPPEWAKNVENAIGRKGAFKGGVLSFGLPRAEAVTMNGMTIAPAQGIAESINFQEAGAGKVATTGDFVLTAEEVNAVIATLEEHKIDVTALHSHMLTEQPRLFFMHFWALGNPEPVAAGIAAALKRVAIK
ncbi:MAG TPA: DUF1259 domain-containing protein [Candidatus Acidoferrales bacterium]|nr:DUF1259 domain-containing protein [Candidatus Acidoferrales bacterium]